MSSLHEFCLKWARNQELLFGSAHYNLLRGNYKSGQAGRNPLIHLTIWGHSLQFKNIAMLVNIFPLP